MPDNGDNIINGLDIDWDASLGAYRFDLTSNRGDMILDDGMSGVRLFGHGHDVTSLNLNDTNYGVWVWDWDIFATGRSYGVVGQNLHGAIFYEVDSYYASTQGMSLHGDGVTIAYSDIGSIGNSNSLNVVAGLALLGSNYNVYGATIFGLYSATEAYAVGFNSSGGTGNELNNSLLNGTGSTNWTFGVWSSNSGDVHLDGVTMNGWTWASGGGPVYAVGSTIDVGYFGNIVLLDTASSISQTTSGAATLYGTTGHDALLGDDSAQTFYPGGGTDVIQGFGGADTFHFATYSSGAVTTIIDFETGLDSIVLDVPTGTTFQAHGTSALGSGPVVVQNTYNDTFYFDPDGAGSAAWTPFAYTPGSTLVATDFQFI